MRLLEAPDEALGPTLKGRPVPDVAASKESRGELKKKQPAKRKRVEYEQRVHKIRVEANGKISEIREIRRRGGNGTTTTTVEEDGDGAASTSTEAAGGSSSGGAAAARDEQSELWAQHRLLNEAVYARRHGGALRVEVGDDWAPTRSLSSGCSRSTRDRQATRCGLGHDAGEFDWPAARRASRGGGRSPRRRRRERRRFRRVSEGMATVSISSASNARRRAAVPRTSTPSRSGSASRAAASSPSSAPPTRLAPAEGRRRPGAARLANFGVGTGNKKAPPPGSDEESDEEAGSEEEEEEPRLMFKVPLPSSTRT